MALKIPNLEDNIDGCEHFSWREALWLPSWNRAATEDDGLTQEILDNLKNTFKKMDKVREYFGKSISVHVSLRPMKYHKELYAKQNADRKRNGLEPLKVPMGSAHLSGMGVDFHVKGMKCAVARQKILDDGKLEEWGMRMEDIQGEWIHLDTKPVISKRFFKP